MATAAVTGDERKAEAEVEETERAGDLGDASGTMEPGGEDAASDEQPDQGGGAAASLEAAGVTPEELAACVSVLRRLDDARERLDWRTQEFRELKKALVPLCGEAFGQLPQKSALDAKERAKAEKNRKRERRQRQVEADKKWQNNAQLRASRLAQLEALEGPPSAAGPLSLLDQEPFEAAAEAETADAGKSTSAPFVGPSHAARQRIPDGPAVEGQQHGGCTFRAAAASAERSMAGEDADERGDDAGEYGRQQACYTCKARFSDRHHFYSHLCPACSALNFRKRQQTCDMEGRVCLVTGARVKIGFQTALKLLRMGARVIATTRFPEDARRRYAAEADAEDWMGRLQLRGVDFRFLGAVERLCTDLLEREAWLDVIVNNACQTIRRPAGYYRHLLEGEAKAATPALAAGARADSAGLVDEPAAEVIVPSAAVSGAAYAVGEDSVAMSQLQVLAEDAMSAEEAAVALPRGEFDVHGQQLDTRARNSWLLKLGEVSTPETVEVFCINALTPFVLNGRLRPLLERSPYPDRYIVNVSAMEGKFYRYKQPTHPHTNMAKAALNMMTRTSAEEYVRISGIYMNSVDTGWINDENPLPTAQRIAADHGFQTPIDEVDAAARILDPVVTGITSLAAGGGLGRRARKGGGGAGGGGGSMEGVAEGGPAWGRFFKDYFATEW